MVVQSMRSESDVQDILGNLRALAQVRRARGDPRMRLSPVPTPQEFTAMADQYGDEPSALVLEPTTTSAFTVLPIAARQRDIGIGAFCDGTRATYYLGIEGTYPLLYTENFAVVRYRDDSTGFHGSYYGIRDGSTLLLAPFGRFDSDILQLYRSLGLFTARHADLCTVGGTDDFGLTPHQQRQNGNLAWQVRGQRRARWLMEQSEQHAALAAARMLRTDHPGGARWLLKDGSLFQFDRRFLTEAEPLRQIVGVVKSHPVPFFGVEGENKLARMDVGERSVAFLPGGGHGRSNGANGLKSAHAPMSLRSLSHSQRTLVSWYLRVREPEPTRASCYSGIVRLDIAATDDWRQWVDEVSWAVLDEFYGLSSLPDARSDVLAYGIHECEQSMSASRLPGELLLAALLK
jgi:hypothetical protein